MVKLQVFDFKKYSLLEREMILSDIDHSERKNSIIIKTCNRIEIYKGDGLIPEDIANHLFRLVSGLESKIIGETSIQGQVKASYIASLEKGGLGKSLNKLFQFALYVGKKVRTRSRISIGAMSHAQATVDIIKKYFDNLDCVVITIIGVHNLSESILRYLTNKGAVMVFVSNRNYEKASRLAQKYSFSAFSIEKLQQMLPITDVLISATSAPHLIVRRENFPLNKPMHIFDLAFPRDIDENIGTLKNVVLYNLEGLENEISKNIDLRKDAVFFAEEIIADELKKFHQWQIKEILYNEIY
jgi:glutamyl-tRNA reductase